MPDNKIYIRPYQIKNRNIMAAYQHNCKISVSTETYFSNLNPIAKQIAFDVNATKTKYGRLWNTLTASEQDDIINETLIRPELTIHYYEATTATTPPSTPTALNESTNSTANRKAAQTVCDLRSLRNFNQLTIASKLVQDDNFGVYRDEHSAPFSYRTRSQINLTLFDNEETKTTTTTSNQKTEKGLNCSLKGAVGLSFEVKQPQARLLPAPLARDSERNGNCLKSQVDGDQHTRFKTVKAEQESISYSPPPDDDKINLKYYFGSRKKLSDSNSSVASTDDDDLEDKRLCTEKVKLLESDSDIRRGFDFLNNW